jgi:hypothetical protein
LIATSTFCPLCTPTPTAWVMDFRVRCWSMGLTLSLLPLPLAGGG